MKTERPVDPAQMRRIQPVAPTARARFRAFLAKRETRVYAESVVLTALLPLVGLLVQSGDPLFLRNGFSWLAVPPVLVALRHGFGPGVTSALLLVVMVVIANGPGHRGLSGLPSELLYGVVLLTMIVGQVAAAMTRKLDKLEGDHRHLRTQFDGFSRSYMLLELSHERLEQRAVSGVSSLRAALSSLLAGLTAEGASEPNVAAIAERTLAVMASYGRVQAAGLHVVDAGGALANEPVASVGAPKPLAPGDALTAAALETGEVVHSPGRDDTATDLLAAIPLIDAHGVRVGVVAIRALPFVALESSNLRLLFVVGGYAAEAMRGAGGDAQVKDDQRRRFVVRLERAAADARDVRTPSAVMAFGCPRAARGSEVLENLVAKDLRSTDFPILRRSASGDPRLFVVLPLTDGNGTLAFRGRVDRLARERFGADLAALGVATKTWLLSETNTDTVLDEIAAMEAHEDDLARSAG